MAITDIVAQSGDAQDFIVEIPAGNAAFVPADALVETDGSILCVEIPLVTGGGGGNIFIMSE
ncbi:MAG: hypothetical protein NTV02_02675 [Candidatus Zambryskibacteria bacterium]|nr:hypothetical protein [Candidatus Zambryskibacteria bacterium]